MDAIFKALNDPGRRALLDSLRQQDGQSLSELEAQLDMTRFGVMKHLKVLEDASLIVPRRKGRFKYHYLNAVPLQEVIDRWIDPFLVKPTVRAVIDLKNKLEGGAPMLDTEPKPDFMMQTYIRCTQDALWAALTDPQAVIHYHFMATRADGSLELGGAARYFLADGSEMLTIRVTSISPKTRIDMAFEPKWQAGAEASRCVYIIDVEGDHCRLTVEHYDIPAGQEGVMDGWHRMISGLKSYLETGQPARFPSASGQS